MAAPDKIYIEIDNKAHVYFGLQPENAVEYINKDALLEWADNWKKLSVSEDFLYAMEILVQHLNSM